MPLNTYRNVFLKQETSFTKKKDERLPKTPTFSRSAAKLARWQTVWRFSSGCNRCTSQVYLSATHQLKKRSSELSVCSSRRLAVQCSGMEPPSWPVSAGMVLYSWNCKRFKLSYPGVKTKRVTGKLDKKEHRKGRVFEVPATGEVPAPVCFGALLLLSLDETTVMPTLSTLFKKLEGTIVCVIPS